MESCDVDNFTESDIVNETMANGTTGVLPPYGSATTVAIAVCGGAVTLFIVLGNTLVCVVIIGTKAMKGVQNLFLVSLAFSDVTVGTLVMPFKLANELMGYWYFGQTWCDIYLALDVFACTASIFNLCAISIDRYWAITKPIKYLSMRTRRRVGVMIAIVWMSSALVCLPPLFGWKSGDDALGDKHEASDAVPSCQLNSAPGYVLFSTVSSFYIPLGVLIFVYTSIIRAIRRRFKVRNKNADDRPANKMAITGNSGPSQKRSKTSESEDSFAFDNKIPSDLSDSLGHLEKQLKVLSSPKLPSFSPRGPYFDGKNVVLPTTSKDNQSRFEMVTNNSSSDQDIHCLPGVEVVQPSPEPAIPPRPSAIFKLMNKEVRPQSRNKSAVRIVSRFREAKRSKGPEDETEAVDTSSRLQRRRVREKLRAAQAKERKSLSIIFCVVTIFIVCWLPFFVCYLVVTLCKTCWVPPSFFMFVEWMGYGNSALNPVIYALFNKDFREGIKILFRRNTYHFP